ncbi:hypothetical protein C8J57DRAFT_1245711 [Mycena rebaudengoi]|nr:hypothetical protein C8J57DRAFT_1245711 [Mycena rebaudengoi]
MHLLPFILASLSLAGTVLAQGGPIQISLFAPGGCDGPEGGVVGGLSCNTCVPFGQSGLYIRTSNDEHEILAEKPAGCGTRSRMYVCSAARYLLSDSQFHLVDAEPLWARRRLGRDALNDARAQNSRTTPKTTLPTASASALPLRKANKTRLPVEPERASSSAERLPPSSAGLWTVPGWRAYRVHLLEV